MLAFRRVTRQLGLTLVAILLSPLLVVVTTATVAASAAIVVNTTTDTVHPGPGGCAGTGTGTCSLRDAVIYANSHAGTVISVPAGLYKLTIPPSGSDNDTTGDLNISADMTINGAGAGGTTIDGGVIADGIFTVTHASVSLTGLTLANGLRFKPSLIHGGALYVDLSTTVVVSDCAFFHNLDDGYSGSGSGVGGGNGEGGAIFTNDTLVVVRSTFTNNIAQGGDGDVAKNGGTALGGAIMIASTSSSTSVSDSTFTGNAAIGGTGGNGDPSGSLPGPGASGGVAEAGAIYLEGGVSASILRSTFVNNSAVGGNGGVGASSFASGGTGGAGGNGFGGGVLLNNSPNTLNVSNSTFVLNNATGGKGGNGGGFGSPLGSGGMGGSGQAGAVYTSVTDAIVTNVTIDGNSAVAGIGGVGGGGTHGAPGTSFVGGIYNGNSAQVINTIVSNNGVGGNCGGTITNGGHNLQFNPNSGCGSTPFTVGDPKLTPLANYGGPTKTRGIGPGSAALDAGDDTYCGATPVGGLDQRGIARPQGAHCDIGAYEYPIVTTPPASRGGPHVGGVPNAIPPARSGGSGGGIPSPLPPPRQ